MEDDNIVSLRKERIERYIEKMEHLHRYHQSLKKWVRNVDKKGFLSLKMKDQFAIYHGFQLIIEIITDLIAMLVKDLKIKPKDDYSNIECLQEQKILSETLSKNIKKMNGLRNVIVHDYNGMDELLAFNGIKENLKNVKKFDEVMRKWLRKNS